MRIEIRQGGNQPKKAMIASDILLRYLIIEDENVDTIIMCNPSHVSLVTTDFNLYEALGSIKPYDDFKFNKLVKLLEAVEVMSYGQKKPVLTHERVEELRKIALNNQNKIDEGGKNG